MTYWYPGVQETIELLRNSFPDVAIFLGGIYATLCKEHARKFSGADQILSGPWDGAKMKVIAEFLGDRAEPEEEGFPSWPYPAFDLYACLPYVCLLTRRGCPFSCTYCASSQLAGGFESRAPEKVVEEIFHWVNKFGVQDFAFSDDALLLNPSTHLLPILKEVIGRKILCRFHAPNALHVKPVDPEVADFLFRGGFKTVRLGLETSDGTLQAETGGKVTNQEFRRAVESLRKAGYEGEEIGVYLMVGLPGQKVREVKESIAFVRETGAKPILVEYSPIPGTPMFEKAKKVSPFDIENEPLCQNNSIFPCQWEGFTWEEYRKLKSELQSSA